MNYYCEECCVDIDKDDFMVINTKGEIIRVCERCAAEYMKLD